MNPALLAAALAAFLLAAGPALAQGTPAAAPFPSKPVRIVVPFPPGALTDTIPRMAAERLKAEWGQSVIMDNRPGAGGQIASEHVAKSPPDGHTLLVALPDTVVIAPLISRSMRYDPARELAPVTVMVKQAFVLVTRQDLGAATLADLVKMARSAPGTLKSASWGEGSTGHLALEVFKTASGTDIVHVPYKGAQLAMTDVIGGRVDMMITGYSTAGPHLKTGRLRALGRTAATRSPQTPEIPTIAEQGYAGFDVQSWYAIMAPGGTPRATIDVIQRAFTKALAAPEIVEKIASYYAEPASGSADEFAALLAEETRKWSAVVKAAKIQAE